MRVDRKELQELSKIRLKEASALLELGLSDGAYYLAGFAVECALKACIAKATQRGGIPRQEKGGFQLLAQLARIDQGCRS